MPNHITNRLIIQGPEQDLAKLVKQVSAAPLDHHFAKVAEDSNVPVFSFDNIVPMPPEVFRGDLSREDETKFPGTLNWYGWSCKFWGTKWNCYDVSIEQEEGCVVYRFDTAWSSPNPVIKVLAASYPNLVIEHTYIDEDSHGRNHGINCYAHGGLVSEESFDGDKAEPDGQLAKIFQEIKGRNPFNPSCYDCGEDLSIQEIELLTHNNQLVERPKRICNSCRKDAQQKASSAESGEGRWHLPIDSRSV